MPVGDAQPQISEVLTETERELQHLRHEIEMLTKAGVIEVAIRNPSVREYMDHWEKRAEKAEAALEAAALDAQGASDPAFIEAMATEYTRLAWSSAPLSTWPAADRDLIIDRFRQSYLAAMPAPQPSTGR